MRAVVALLSLLPSLAFAYQVEVLKQTGHPDNRIDLVILGDGYRAQDQQQLTSDATELMNQLFNATPFNQYKSLFNIRLIHVVSKQNGADQGSFGATRDTALGAYFNCGSIDRLICLNGTAVAAALAEHTPDFDFALIIVNDPKYGGSGGQYPITSIEPNAPLIVVHELGHTIGGLADEYETPYPGYPACGFECDEANATKNPTASVKWASWISPSTPIPTPVKDNRYSSQIGVFQGCRYETSGTYRPKDEGCMMRALGQPYCAVCAEQMTKSFWNNIPDTFDLKSPAISALGAVCGDVTFSVVTPPGPTFQYAWYVNGASVVASGRAFRFTPTDQPATVSVRARDTTTLVRDDPNNLLEGTASWTLQSGGSTCTVGLCDVSATCHSDGGCDRVFKAQGDSCGEPTCRNGARTTVGACDNNGACTRPASSVSCNAYGCDDAGVECRTQCRFAGDCAPGFDCANEVCSADAGAQELRDSGFVTVPGTEIVLDVATAEQPVAGCGCSAVPAPLLFFGVGAVLLRRRRD